MNTLLTGNSEVATVTRKQCIIAKFIHADRSIYKHLQCIGLKTLESVLPPNFQPFLFDFLNPSRVSRLERFRRLKSFCASRKTCFDKPEPHSLLFHFFH